MEQSPRKPFLNRGRKVGSQFYQDTERYRASAVSTRFLSVEEEYRLIKTHQQSQNEAEQKSALEKLIIAHRPFIISYTQTYAMEQNLTGADMLQAAEIGFMRAVRKFDFSYRVRLTSASKHFMAEEILNQNFYNHAGSGPFPKSKPARKFYFNFSSIIRNNEIDTDRNLNQESHKKVAAQFNIPAATLSDLYQHFTTCHPASLSFANTDGSSDESALQNKIHYTVDGPPEQLMRREKEANEEQILQEGLALLDPRARDIIEQRWLREDDKKTTLDQLAKQYDVSTERIRQIENQALRKIQRHFGLVDEAPNHKAAHKERYVSIRKKTNSAKPH